MSKVTLTELKRTIAEILDEAKKKKVKAEKIKNLSAQVEAYGYYDEAHDFSPPLGARNLYRQQGAMANWGPLTSYGTEVDVRGAGNPSAGSASGQLKMNETDERALRSLVREVIRNGLIDESSAWSPLLRKSEPIFESTWEEIAHTLTEKNWFDKKSEADRPSGKPSFDKDKKRGSVKKHGAEKK